MILSDVTIKELIAKKELIIEPLKEEDIQPSSVDSRLSNEFLFIESHDMDIITFDTQISYRKIVADKITIPPHSFVLATTKEYFELPDNLTAFVEGRSSIGRMGLFIQNAGWVDAGFKGNITLELYNANNMPIKLEAGRRICQFVFCEMDKSAQNPYKGKYTGQVGVTGSKVFKDYENTKC